MLHNKDSEYKGAKVMIIDDEPSDFRYLSEMLTSEDFEVITVTKPDEIFPSIQTFKPGIILLNSSVAGQSGFEICRRLKADRETDRIPVIFISDKQHLENKISAFAFGGVDYVVKPLNSEEVLARIKTHLSISLLRNRLTEANAALKAELNEKKILENDLRIHQELLNTTFESIGDGVICTDANGIVTMVNRVASKLTGWNAEEAIGRPFAEVFWIINEFTRISCCDPIEKVLRTGKVIGLANHTLLISKNGDEISIADSAAPIIDNNGKIWGVVLIFRDVTDERNRQRQIEYQAFHDHMTGLYNKMFFEEELKRLDTDRNLPLAIIIGDINNLKHVNDNFGHAKGDEMIIAAGEAIKSSCRSDDILCRLGGDEFAVLLPKTGSTDAEQIIRRIEQACSNTRIEKVNLSIALGYAVKERPTQSMDDVIKAADDAAYTKKLLDSNGLRGSIISALLSLMSAKSEWEEKHSINTTTFCDKIAKAFNLSDKDKIQCRLSFLLHDIGKIAIDEDILTKKGRLTEEEWSEIRRHPEIGYRIIRTLPAFAETAEYVLLHHERWDGKGYPKGLKGDQIPYLSRILAIVDSYDAMTNDRPYRKAYSQEYAASEIIKNAGKQFDPDIARTFVEKVLEKEWIQNL